MWQTRKSLGFHVLQPIKFPWVVVYRSIWSTVEEFQALCEQIRNVKLAFRGEKETQEEMLNPLLPPHLFPKPQRVLDFERRIGVN